MPTKEKTQAPLEEIIDRIASTAEVQVEARSIIPTYRKHRIKSFETLPVKPESEYKGQGIIQVELAMAGRQHIPETIASLELKSLRSRNNNSELLDEDGDVEMGKTQILSDN